MKLGNSLFFENFHFNFFFKSSVFENFEKRVSQYYYKIKYKMIIYSWEGCGWNVKRYLGLKRQLELELLVVLLVTAGIIY